MTAMLPDSLTEPSKHSIWQLQKQQLIERLASQGIHIAADDPRLNQPVDESDDDSKFAACAPDSSDSASPDAGGRQSSRNAADTSGESLLIGKDPASEADRRRRLREATRQQLQQQILEKQKRIEREQIEKRSELQTESPFSPGKLGRMSPLPFSPNNLFPSNPSSGSDLAAERERRRQKQLEMSRILQQQIQEKAIKNRLAQSSTASDFSTSTRAPFLSDFASPTPQRLGSAEKRISSTPPLSLSALDRDPEQEMSRRRRSQADLNSFLRLQIQERQNQESSRKLSSGSEQQYQSPFFRNESSRSRTLRSPDYSEGQVSKSVSSESPLQRAFSIGEKLESPDVIRERKNSYAAALREQMVQSPNSFLEDKTDRRSKVQLAARFSESPSASALPLGEKIETPEIVRQRRKDYAEALQAQMLERKQRELQKSAGRDQRDPDQCENDRFQEKILPACVRNSSPSRESTRCSSPFRDPEGSRPSAFQDTRTESGLRSNGNIFDYDPVEAAAAQKLQRKKFGEDLRRQREEHQRRKEEQRLKEEQATKEYNERILKQLEAMNSAHRTESVCVDRKEEAVDRKEEACIDEPKCEPAERLKDDEPRTKPNNPEGSKRHLSPVLSVANCQDNVDWKQTESDCIQPLLNLKSKLVVDSGELRQRIREQQLKIQKSGSGPEPSVDMSQSLPNTSSWLPVESDSEEQLPVKSEFVEVPVSPREPILSDEDYLERFVNESQVPSPQVLPNPPRRRSKWGSPMFPASMPLSELGESRPLTPSETILRTRSRRPGFSYSDTVD